MTLPIDFAPCQCRNARHAAPDPMAPKNSCRVNFPLKGLAVAARSRFPTVGKSGSMDYRRSA